MSQSIRPSTIIGKISGLVTDPTYRDLLSKSLFSFFSRTFGVFLGLVFSILIGRRLGPEGLGAFSIMMSVLFPMSVASRLGLDNLLVRMIPAYNHEHDFVAKRRTYRRASLTTLALSLVIGGGLFLLRPLFSREIQTTVGAVAAILAFHALLLLNVQALKGELKVELATLLENTLTWLLAIMLFVVLWSTVAHPAQLPILSYAFGLMATFLVSIVVIQLVFRNRARGQAQKSPPGDVRLQTMLRASFPMFITAMVGILIVSIDVWLLTYFRPQFDVGIYTAAVKLLGFVSFPLTALINIAGPRFAEAHAQQDRDKLQEQFQKAAQLSVWGGLPLLLMIVLFPAQLLGLFGDSFTAGISVIYLLAFGQLINIAMGPIGYFLLMTGEALTLQYIMLSTLVISIVTNVILIPMFGINGAAIAGAMALLWRNLACWYLVRRRFGFNALYIPGSELFSRRP